MTKTFTIADTIIDPGTRQRVEFQVARLPTGTWLSIPVEVLHGKKSGPKLWISAAVHGDELNGVEIIRRVLERITPKELSGTLLVAPVVNVFGFIEQSRYLPDRRDLNRSFPGAAKGSLAGRMAHLFLSEVVRRCDYGIDLHTGSHHRANLPQIRADLRNDRTRELAERFGAPVIMHAAERSGSLRATASKLDIPVLLYEAGEALRFDEESIRVGTEGVINVMRAIDMLPTDPDAAVSVAVEAGDSSWVRARRSGLIRLDVALGDRVKARQKLATISNVLGGESAVLRSGFAGMVIGICNLPLVNQGQAVLHIARIPDAPAGVGDDAPEQAPVPD